MYFFITATAVLIAVHLVQETNCSLALRDADIKDGDPIPQMPLGNTSYVVFRKSLSWLEARRICETTIGRLGVFYNEDDGYDVIDAIEAISIPFSETYDRKNNSEEFGMDRRYWFGLSDIGLEGDWTWMDDGRQLTYNSLWYMGQPDHIRDRKLEHCVCLWNPIYYLRENHSWNDEPCEHKLYFICEREPPGGFKGRRALPFPPMPRVTKPPSTTEILTTPTSEPTTETLPTTTTEETTTPTTPTPPDTPTTATTTPTTTTTTPATTTTTPTTITTTPTTTTTTPTTTTTTPTTTTTTPTTTTTTPTTTTTTPTTTTTTPTTTTTTPTTTTTTPTTTTTTPTTTFTTTTRTTMSPTLSAHYLAILASMRRTTSVGRITSNAFKNCKNVMCTMGHTTDSPHSTLAQRLQAMRG